MHPHNPESIHKGFHTKSTTEQQSQDSYQLFDFLQNLSSGMNKVYKYVQRRQMSDVCLKLTDDINLWQKIVRVLVQDAK